jgi:beta propeller repeat protein
VVYSDTRGADTDVWYYDLTTGTETQVTSADGDQELSDVSNGVIVFTDYTTLDVLVYSTLTGATTNLTGSAGSVSFNPAIGAGLVAWEDRRDGNPEVYGVDLGSGEERRVTNDIAKDGNPAVGGGVVAFERCTQTECDIVTYDWLADTTRRLTQTETGDERRPDVSGARVVYDALRDGERDIYLYDLVAGTESRLSLPGEQINPSISGDYVAFEDSSSGTSHIGLWHIPSGSVSQVTTGPGAQWLNDIDGQRIVYTDDREGQLDIYMFEFNVVPIADAGIPQSAHIGNLVTMDGSKSIDYDKNYPLSYAWIITEQPAGSTATLTGSDTVSPSFTPEKPGDYTISLVVTDSKGLESDANTVQISTYNTPPIADAGDDQALSILGTVHLDGTHSYDEDGDPITYQWTMTARPAGSSTILYDPASAIPTFVADRYGEYVITLVVTDSFDAQSEEDSVTASFTNVKPVANAGENQAVFVGTIVNLNGSGSSDANNDSLTFEWSIVSKPDGSMAELSNTTTVQTSFIADKVGDYVISLVVNDGLENSDPCSVKVTAISTNGQVVDKLKSLIDAINALYPDDLKNENMKNALTNKVNAVLQMIDQGLYRDALDKLEHDILKKTDGCAETGAPDKNDWITNCEAQATIYPLVIQAMELLRNLI